MPTPDLTSVLLTLRPVAPLTLPFSHGHLAYKAALELFMNLSPKLSHDLHQPQDRKPFTISPLLGGLASPVTRQLSFNQEQTYGWRLTGLNAEVSEVLASLANGSAVRGVRLHEAVFTLEAAEVQKSASYIQLLERWEGKREKVHATLNFSSPTTFRVGSFEQPFPLPHWVFGSLLDAWNSHTAPLEPLDLSQLGLTRWNGKTHRVELGSKLGGTVGFTGQFGYQALYPDSPLNGRMGLLATYAEYAGVGWLTTNGLGQVTPEFKS